MQRQCEIVGVKKQEMVCGDCLPLRENLSLTHKSGFHSSCQLSPVITPLIEYAIQYSQRN